MIHMIGNAHIDPVWLWDWREGYQEVKATFRSALDRLAENGEFVFTCACADYYRYVEQNAPDMFEEIRGYVALGRWVIVGGMWIQPDCNIPCGESFARQLLYSQRYFREKFGKCAVTGYNVDSFGHGATIPQLLAGAGIKNYVFMRPGEHENADILSPVFEWVAPDGSSVTAFRIPDSYGNWGFGNIAAKIDMYRKLASDYDRSMMCFYGVGNHGGGPTIANLREIDGYRENFPDAVAYSSPDKYFEEIRQNGTELPAWRREMQHHASGCYSAFSTIKRMNRKAENALFQAESFGVLAEKTVNHKSDSLKQGFYNLMFNQFHDVMCGCCIREAYEDAIAQLDESVSIAARVQTAALQSLSWRVDTSRGLAPLRSKDSHFALWEHAGRGTPVVVFNSNAFSAKGPVRIMGKLAKATDENGGRVAIQTVRASRTNGSDKWDSLFMAEVPAFGWRLYWVYLEGEEEIEAADGLSVSQYAIENDCLAARFDPATGALSSLVIKDVGYEALSAPALVRLIDIEHVDTWAHGVFAFDKEAGAFADASFEVLETGPVRACLRVASRCGDSTLIQEFTLYAGSDQLEVEARLDMREKFRMAKLCFPTGKNNAVTRAEIAYGVITRDMSGREDVCQRFVQIGAQRGGLAVVNDGKYSFSALKGELRLTAANTSIYADHYGQQNRDRFCRHMDMGEQTFSYALVPHAGDWREAALNRRAELFHRPLRRVVETYHKGELPARYSGLTVSPDNVAVGAIKRAENGEGYIIRLAETSGRDCEARVDAPIFNRELRANLAPWQIKTYLLPDDANADARELLLTEYIAQEHSRPDSI